MGCVSSSLLNNDGELRQIGVGHHIVSLTSSTYGFLTLDPNPETDPPSAESSEPEVINSWELMAGLDPDPVTTDNNKLGDGFEELCPPNGENKVVIYTTTLRGIRDTFEACNAVRAAMEGLGVLVCERDISMDRGFREELSHLLKGKNSSPPRVFVKGRYLGGAQQVLDILQQDRFQECLQGLPKIRAGYGHMCEGCGGFRFLPCFKCNGSCKIIRGGPKQGGRGNVVTRCADCNENGLVLCPICS